MDQTYMKKQNILKLLLTMALPMVISMLVNSLYNIVDSFFVAKISENAMTAISLVFPMQNFINSVMIGFGIGINAVIAFYMGASDKETADKAASQGLFLSTVHGIVLMAGCIILIRPFLNMFTNDQTVIDLGVKYSVIAFAFSLMLAWELVFEKTFQAVGRMTVSMTAMLAGCITNIILDPVLIFGPGIFPRMGIEGAALATGIGQTVSLIVYIIIYIVRPIPVRFTRKHMKPEKVLCVKMYSIGIPACLNMALPSLLISALNVILAAYSQVYVFVLGVYISFRHSCIFLQMELYRGCDLLSDTTMVLAKLNVLRKYMQLQQALFLLLCVSELLYAYVFLKHLLDYLLPTKQLYLREPLP